MIRIMTTNIWGDYFGNPIEAREDDAFEVYKKLSPDIIGFQEATKSWNGSKLFARLSDGYNFVGTERCYTNIFVPMAVKKDIDILATGFQFLRRVPDDSKSITWAVLKNKDGKSFGVCNTHFWWMQGYEPEYRKKEMFESFGEIAYYTNEEHKNLRAENAKQLVSLMRYLKNEYGCPVFALGDMNCTRRSRVFTDVYKNSGVTHLFDIAKEKDDICSIHGDPSVNDEGKYHGKSPERDHTWSIDHIVALGSDFEAVRYKVVTDEIALGVSDHSPVYADVKI